MKTPVYPEIDEIREFAYLNWEKRGRGHGFDLEDWRTAEELLMIYKNYKLIGKHPLVAPSKTPFGSTENRKCRFCGQVPPEAKFSTTAHAIPEFLGNKALFSRDECDACNNYFSGTVENALAELTLLYCTLGRVYGKKNSKVFETGRRGPRVESKDTHVHIKDFDTNRLLNIDESNQSFQVKDDSKLVVPLLIFKCFLKMAIAIMPESLLEHVIKTIDWLRNPDLSFRPPGTEKLAAYLTFVPGSMEDYAGATFLFQRKVRDANLPAFLFLVSFKNLSFQIALPLTSLDLALVPPVEIFPIPHWHVFDSVTGPPKREILDLSSGEKLALIQVVDGRFQGILKE